MRAAACCGVPCHMRCRAVLCRGTAGRAALTNVVVVMADGREVAGHKAQGLHVGDDAALVEQHVQSLQA